MYYEKGTQLTQENKLENKLVNQYKRIVKELTDFERENNLRSLLEQDESL